MQWLGTNRSAVSLNQPWPADDRAVLFPEYLILPVQDLRYCRSRDPSAPCNVFDRYRHYSHRRQPSQISARSSNVVYLAIGWNVQTLTG